MAVSSVNGVGQWHSFEKQFNTQIQAVLEIVDNGIDAATITSHLRAQLQTRHSQRRASFEPQILRVFMDSHSKGLIVQNSCLKEVAPMKEVLMLHNSKKQATNQVGEFGVGINQACANVSDLSFILTKSWIASEGNHRLELGILSKDLQTENAFVAPSMSFESDDDILQMLNEAAAKQKATIGKALKQYGIEPLAAHFESLLMNRKQDHMFVVLFARFSSSDQISFSDQASVLVRDLQKYNERRSKNLILQLKDELPRRYLHIDPNEIEVFVEESPSSSAKDGASSTKKANGDPILFTYWQSRLVELTQFDLYLDRTKNFTWETWLTPCPTKKHIRIFLGFDALRLSASSRSAECSLHLHSRQSGRLIKSESDARRYLNLVTSGSKYCQGLTILIDDVHGALP